MQENSEENKTTTSVVTTTNIDQHNETPQQHIDELFQQLNQMREVEQQKAVYFQQNSKQKQPEFISDTPDISKMSKLPPNLFADYAKNNESNQFSNNKSYLEKLKKYAPKLVTIQETKKFWKMYQKSLSSDQVQILQDYVQSQQSYIERQKFINKTNQHNE